MTAEGDLVAGRYRLMSEVGRGAMGVVWRARDERLDRDVAVKELTPDDKSAGHATREGRVAARVPHPHVVIVHDVVQHAGTAYLVMEYFPSRSLSAMGVRSSHQAAVIGSQVAGALAAAHAEGVVHRDIKPGNILVGDDGIAKIADFGISRALGDDSSLTGAGIIAGTPAYLAPEVAAGGPAIFSADVFSLGATLYAATEGTPPFGHDDNPIALLHRVARDEIRPARRNGPLTDVILWMLRRNPAERPTMREASVALAAIAEGRPVLPPPRLSTPDPTLVLPPSGHQRLDPASRSRASRKTIGVGVAAMCLLVAGIIIGTMISQNSATQAAHTETRTATPTTVTTGNSPCAAELDVVNTWPGGYQASVVIRNTGRPKLTGWTVQWTLPAGNTINTLWGGSPSRDGFAVTVTNLDWNATVGANDSVLFGFTASGSTSERPTVSCQSP